MANKVKNTQFQLIPTTWEELRAAFGLVLVLASIIFSWANLSTQIQLLVQKTDNTTASLQALQQQDSQIIEKQSQMSTDLTRLDTIVADAQARGLLSRANVAPTKSVTMPNSALALEKTNSPSPTPSFNPPGTAGQSANQPQQITINNSPQPTPVPAPVPAAAQFVPVKSTTLPTILTPVLDALGL